jgi:methylamine dehydrogenase accessory protein MauD
LRQARLATALLVTAFLLGVYLLHGGGFSKPAPAFSLPEPDGGQVDLSSYAGRPVLLVFWTTSCPICQRELPMLDRMNWEFRDRGIDVLTICLGGEGEARDYLSSNRIALKTVYDAQGKVGQAYSVGGVPRFVLIDKDGKVKRSSSGWANEEVLREWMGAVS